jgi:hypothetical protein
VERHEPVLDYQPVVKVNESCTACSG